MTTTHAVSAAPRRAALDRPTAMRLAATEYERVVTLLRSLPPEAWHARTACPDWDVRADGRPSFGDGRDGGVDPREQLGR